MKVKNDYGIHLNIPKVGLKTTSTEYVKEYLRLNPWYVKSNFNVNGKVVTA